MRCCNWAASWLSSGSVTIGNFLPLHYVILSDTFAQHKTLPFTPTPSGCPMFAPAYVGQQSRGEAPSKVCLFSLPTTNVRVPHPSRSLRRVGEAEYAPMFVVRKNC